MTALVASLVQVLNLGLLYACNAQSNKIVPFNDCTCPRHNVSYRCTVDVPNSLFTVWNGTIIMDIYDSCQLSLGHGNDFTMSSVFCRNRTLEAQGVLIVGDVYTSQLTVPARDELQGRTITCSVDNGTSVTLVDIITLNLSQEPPTNVQFVEVTPHILIFEWENTRDLDCRHTSYLINAQNCGNCDYMTSSTNATCIDFVVPSNCTVNVSTVMCGNLSLRSPDSMATASLKVPDAPKVINSIPYYSGSSIFLRVVTKFYSLGPVDISHSIDGSPTNYFISYTDSNGQLCALDTIPPSSCILGVCTHTLEQMASQCTDREATITPSVFATNVLGKGDITEYHTFGINNDFVSIKLSSDTQGLNCTFLEGQERITQSCTCAVNISYGDNCSTSLGGEYSSSGPTSSVILIVDFLTNVTLYCYVAKATCGNKTVVVEDTLNITDILETENDTATALIASLSTISSLFIVLLLIANGVVAVRFVYKTQHKIPWMIHFSNEPNAGALADVLRVFKDLKINIIRVNIPWQKSDHEDKTHHSSRIHFDCDAKQKKQISRKFDDSKLKFIGDNSEEGCVLRTAELFLENKPGTLLELLEFLSDMRVNFRGLNTAIRNKARKLRVHNFITCSCSSTTVEKVVKQMRKAGAKDIKAELASKETRKLQVYVQEGPGNLRRILKVVAANNIRLLWINEPSTTDKATRTRQNFVECTCSEEQLQDVKRLLEQHGAEKIDNLPASNPTILKFTVQDEFGSLARALKAFDHKDCKIDIIGVNTQSMAKEPLVKEENVCRLSLTIKCIVCANYKDGDICGTMKDAGFIHNPTESRCGVDNVVVNFSIMDHPQTLAEALSLVKMYIKNLTSVTTQRDVQNTVKYRKNTLVFICSDERVRKLKADIYATCLAIDVTLIEVDDKEKETKSIKEESTV